MAAPVFQGRKIRQWPPKQSIQRRASRVRRQIKKVAGERPRLSVYRSSKNIYAQIIDDAKGHTVASASTLEKDLKGSLKTGADSAAAAAVGKLVAERAVKAGVKEVVFDRGPYIYPRPRQGACRCRPRRRPQLLIFTARSQRAGLSRNPCFRKRIRIGYGTGS